MLVALLFRTSQCDTKLKCHIKLLFIAILVLLYPYNITITLLLCYDNISD